MIKVLKFANYQQNEVKRKSELLTVVGQKFGFTDLTCGTEKKPHVQ